MFKGKAKATIVMLGAAVLSVVADLPNNIPMIEQLNYVVGMSVILTAVFAVVFMLNIALRFTK